MAKKKVDTNTESVEAAKINLASVLDKVIEQKYGYLKAPQPIVTQFNIRPLDALLGGGLYSSTPIMISSTPETGKSTVAFQFSSIFQKTYQDQAVVIYIDVEGGGNAIVTPSQYFSSRIEQFGINMDTFRYYPLKVSIGQVFSILDDFFTVTRELREKANMNPKVLIVWDSIAATPSTKIEGASDPNSVIGYKARELGFYFEKIAPELAFEQITFIGIDQVRANLQMQDRYAPKEKSVGIFKDYKAATSVLSLNHRVGQWLFLSKKGQILNDTFPDVNGWVLGVYTEKNKFAPSKYEIDVVFDKVRGVDKFWSEFLFLSQLTPTEEKILKKATSAASRFEVDFPIKNTGAYFELNYIDEDGTNARYRKKFRKAEAKQLYYNDDEFRELFDRAVDLNVRYRILHRMQQTNEEQSHAQSEEG